MAATPFTLVKKEGSPPVASNGTLALTCPDEGGVIKLRRGIRTSSQAPLGERMIPFLNELAGLLLEHPAMPAHEIASRLHALQMQCQPPVQENVEWAFAELDGVRCYTDGQVVVLTKQDLRI